MEENARAETKWFSYPWGNNEEIKKGLKLTKRAYVSFHEVWPSEGGIGTYPLVPAVELVRTVLSSADTVLCLP